MFAQRAARAVLLADKSDAAREPLEFAAALSKEQAKCVDRLQPLALSGRLAEDAEKLLPLVRPLLEHIADRSEDAEKRRSDAPDTARTHALLGDNARGSAGNPPQPC